MTAATSRLRRRGIGAGVAALVGLTGLGFAAVPAQADANFTLTRPAQTGDRYQTAASIATAAFPTGASDVIIANGENAVDALAASYLSGGTIPVLYTTAGELPEATAAAWTALKPTKTWVVGGTGAVSAAVYDGIAGTKERITGTDRYETAVNIAAAKAGTTAPTTAFIVRGDDFADALAIAPVAAKQGIPVLLTEQTGLNGFTSDALADWGIENVTIIGGTGAISDDVVDDLDEIGVDSTRVFGTTRTATATAIANTAGYGFAKTGVYLVNGFRPVDALPAAVAAAKANSPIILTENGSLGSDAQTYLDTNKATLTGGVAVGGTAVIPADVVTAAETAAGKPVAPPAGQSTNSRPELLSASVVSTTTAGEVTPDRMLGTVVRYTFDEAVSAPAASNGNFKLYNNSGTGTYTDGVVDTAVTRATTVDVRFPSVDTAAKAAVLTLATTAPSAVTDVQGQTNAIGAAAIGTANSGAGTAQPAGVTDAPNLVSIGGFRAASAAGKTAVDFTFDQPAFISSDTNPGAAFHLVFNSASTPGSSSSYATLGNLAGDAAGAPAIGSAVGTTAGGGALSGGTIAGGNGTTTITVVFTNPDGVDDGDTPGQATDPTIAAGSVARAYVAANGVSSVQQTDDNGAGTPGFGALEGNGNPVQFVKGTGDTVGASIASATLVPGDTATSRPDRLQITLTKPLKSGTTPVAADFTLYKTTSAAPAATLGTVVVNSSNRAQLQIDVSDGLANIVGLSVAAGAFTTTEDVNGSPVDRSSAADGIGIANSTQASPVTPGKTAGPELTGVTLTRASSDSFGNAGDFQAVYTFDEDVSASGAASNYSLYLADGRILPGVSTSVLNRTEDTDNTVTVNFVGGGVTSANVQSAVLGAVAGAAVTAEDAGPSNPEGAVPTTGGNGTRQ